MPTRLLMIGTGFTFNDGEQILVSAQKPLGLLLEETLEGRVFVAEVVPNSSASRSGVQVGDIILAVQNANVSEDSVEEVMARIAQSPKVVNLRFARQNDARKQQ